AFGAHGEVDREDLPLPRLDRLSRGQGQRQAETAIRRLARIDVERGAARVLAGRGRNEPQLRRIEVDAEAERVLVAFRVELDDHRTLLTTLDVTAADAHGPRA